jgi:phosphoribosylformimino-5-aminoimidazole carboxamide ribotide isomerase
MILFPAIDLKDGNVVRLLHGDMDKETVFSNSPGDQAKSFEDLGFSWLHMVDLNGAIDGAPRNAEAVNAILASVSMKTQLGGGIRDRKMIDHWLSAGIDRVILGTVAVKNPDLVKEACRAYPGQIVVGIDAREGRVAVEGWVETGETIAVDLAKQFEDAGVAAIIYTDIARDGAMQGVNQTETLALAAAVNIPVVASGGLNGMDDLKALHAASDGKLEGVISGRALYDGRLDPKEALEFLGC